MLLRPTYLEPTELTVARVGVGPNKSNKADSRFRGWWTVFSRKYFIAAPHPIRVMFHLRHIPSARYPSATFLARYFQPREISSASALHPISHSISATFPVALYPNCGTSSSNGIVRFWSRWKARLMGKYTCHRLVARPDLDNTFWTDGTSVVRLHLIPFTPHVFSVTFHQSDIPIALVSQVYTPFESVWVG